MWILLKLAARNVFRNVRRTAITVAAVSLGLALMVMSNNLSYGMYQTMIRTGISTMAGHVVIQGDGYQDSQEMRTFVPDAAAAQAQLDASVGDDGLVVPRMFLQGLITSPNGSVSVAATGLDPVREVEVSDWHEKVVDGVFLSDDDGAIILGRTMAESLQVELGDKVVVMVQGEEDVSSRLFRVRGLIATGSAAADGFLAMITLDAAQELMEAPDVVHQLSVHLDDPDDYAAHAAEIRGALPESVEVLGWPEALPAIHDMVEMDTRQNNSMMFIIGLIVALGVLNTVLMSVIERIREFGVMLALGTAPSKLVTIIVMEGAILGVISVAVGVGLGMLVSWPMITQGVDFSAMMGSNLEVSGVNLDAVVYAAIDWERLIIYSLAGVAMTMLSTIYPAIKAARLRPVESMRHV